MSLDVVWNLSGEKHLLSSFASFYCGWWGVTPWRRGPKQENESDSFGDASYLMAFCRQPVKPFHYFLPLLFTEKDDIQYVDVKLNSSKHPPPILPPQPDWLTSEEIGRRHVIQAIVDSERSYMMSLQKLIQVCDLAFEWCIIVGHHYRHHRLSSWVQGNEKR